MAPSNASLRAALLIALSTITWLGAEGNFLNEPFALEQSCRSIQTKIHISREENDDFGNPLRNCEGSVEVTKCEGTCSSHVQPSLSAPHGFHKVCLSQSTVLETFDLNRARSVLPPPFPPLTFCRSLRSSQGSTSPRSRVAMIECCCCRSATVAGSLRWNRASCFWISATIRTVNASRGLSVPWSCNSKCLRVAPASRVRSDPISGSPRERRRLRQSTARRLLELIWFPRFV